MAQAQTRRWHYHSEMTYRPRTTLSPLSRLGMASCLTLALFGGQAFAQDKLGDPKPPTEEINNSKLSAEWMLMILLGEMKAGQGDSGGGYSLMLEAARKSGDEQLYKRAVEIALAARSGQPALNAAKAWKQAHPKSQEANRYVLQIHVALNQLPDSMLPLRTEILLTPEAEQGKAIMDIASLYTQVQDKELAVAVVEQALVPFADKPATAAASWTTIGRMRVAAKKLPEALDAVKKAIARDPKAMEPGMLALELFSLGVDGAENILLQVLGTADTAAPLRISYARILIDNQRNNDANTQLEWVIKHAPAFSEAWILQAAMLIDSSKDDEAQKGLLRFIALEKDKEGARGLPQAYLMLSQIALRQKKTSESEAWLNKIDDPETLVQVQVQRANLLASRGNVAKARELIRQLPNNTPQANRVKLQAEVKMLRDNKQYEQAYQVLVAAAKESPDDLELRYEVAMMAEKINRIDEMEKLLRSVIEAKPDFQHAYNALGFALADRNIRLKEARELIVTALEFSPDDPMITDSLGWVEFRMGNKVAALAILQRAYDAKNDPEIGAHLGEVHWSLGQRDKALKLWRESKRMAPDNEILLETLKRLKVKL
jgi:tetratricopeptide (TPR) repeat protein